MIGELESTWRRRLEDALTRVLGDRRSLDQTPHGLLSTLSGSDLLATDQALRRESGYFSHGAPGPHAAFPDSVENRPRLESYLFVAACNGNGYVRERALRAFGHYPGPLALAVALIRLNDWVPKVQAAAVSLFRVVLKHVPPSELARQIDLLWRLSRRERIAESVWAQEIEPRLIAAENHDALWAAARDPTISCPVRVFVHGLLLKTSSVSAHEVLSNAIADHHSLIAGWAVAHLDAVENSADRRALIELALKHRHPAVRRFAAFARPHS